MLGKKVIIITLLLALLLLAAGCGTSDNNKSNTIAPSASEPSAQTTKPAAQTSEPIGDKTKPASPSAESSKAAASSSRGPVTSREKEIIDSFIKVQAPDFTLEDKDGNKVTLSSLKGTPVVLNFWATWCPYCIQEFEHFSKAQENFPEIKFYAIDTNEKTDLSDKGIRKSNEDFAREKKLTLPILFDVGSKVYSGQYATQGLPSTFLIDKDGNVRAGFAGAVPDYENLENLLNAFLKA